MFVTFKMQSLYSKAYHIWDNKDVKIPIFVACVLIRLVIELLIYTNYLKQRHFIYWDISRWYFCYREQWISIWNQGIEAQKIWNLGSEAQKIWNLGIEAQQIWNLGTEKISGICPPPPLQYRGVSVANPRGGGQGVRTPPEFPWKTFLPMEK